MAWTETIYQARVADPSARTRHTAGSPSPEEIAVYLAACPREHAGGTALVLGMTPELRVMAAGHFGKVISVDASEIAIGMFTAWMPDELKDKETIIHGRWDRLPELVACQVDVVFGDGIFANLGDAAGTVQLLRAIRSILSPGGLCVMRNVVIPADVATGRYDFPRLLEEFRAGRIDAAEFGFTARMLGFHGAAYEAAPAILHNATVYSRLDGMEADLSDEERSAIGRYRFIGTNYFPCQEGMDRCLEEAGFAPPVRHPVGDKLWHAYYPVHSFAPRGRSGSGGEIG